MRPDWSAYASAYDLLTEHNPEYQALMRDFEVFLETINEPKVIYDLGGGTGNYTEIAARCCPKSEVRLIEPDTEMIQSAQFKLSEYNNISYHNVSFEGINDEGTADLIICVHALYAMPDPLARIRDMRRLLRAGGYLYLIDLGRYLDVPSWRKYLFQEIRKKHGLIGALRVFWQGRQVAKQNQAIYNAQKKGVYWTHTGPEIASAVLAENFKIIEQTSVYRNQSDLLVCRAGA